MIVVNFSHPLTPEQRDQIAALAARPIDRVIDIPTHFDDAQPFAPQVAALVELAGLTPEEWQTLPLLVNPPAYSPIAAVLLAHLHGLCGFFPTILRLRAKPGSVPTAFECVELLGLQSVRDVTRTSRGR